MLKSVKRDQTDTPEFKKWFGNSKVVDADGKPMVVYHGTKGDFTSFDPTHLGKTTLAESAKKGFFFAGNPDTSAQYSLAASPIEHRVEGERWQQEAISAAGIRHSAYRALKDAVGVVKTKPWEPVRIEADAPIETVRLFDAFQSAKSIERAAKEKVENYFDSASERNTRFMVGRVTDEDINEQVTYPVFLSIKNPLVVDFENNGRQITFDELIDQAKSAGNDGVVIKNVADPIPGDTIYVAFEPTQIKSAIGNNGQFDPKNPDIHYSQDGVVQGLFDRSSGISFLIASHLTPETAPAVLLHEVAHGIFTPEMLQEGVKLIDLRDSPLIPKATREFLQQVYEKIEAGKRLISEYGNATEHNLQESAPYLIEHALLKGRQAGFSAIDSAFFDFILSKFGKRISDLMKNWVAKVRITLRKHGIITKIYVDDFIALAQAGLKQAVRGEVNADGDVVSGSRTPKNPDISHSKGIVYEIQPETISVLPDSGANLTELRRAAAKLDAPEKGITFRIEDGKAIVTGPAKTRVPDRFKRFANEHGLVLSVRQRTPMSGWGTNYLGDGKTSQISTGTYAEKPMPIAYRESGALYFGEIGEQRESGSNTQFSIAPISPAAPERAGKDTPEPKIPLVSEPIPGKRFTLQGETQAQRLQRKSQDAQIRWKNVQDQVVSQGGTVTEETDVYKAMERYPGIVAGKMLEFGRDVQEPFLKRIVAAGTTLDEVSLLAYAEHAPERNTGIAKINPLFPNDGTPGKSGSGMTDQDALDIIDYIKSLPNANEIFALAENLREIADNRLDKLVKEGAMSQEQANAYRAKYKKYVPLKGFELVDESGIPQENGKGLSTGKKIDMRALGRKSRAGQIAQNIFRDYEFAIATVEKSVVGKVAAAFIKANPDSALWSVDEAPKKPAYAKGGSVHQVVYFGSVVAEFVHPVDANAYAEELRYKADVESKDVTVESHRLHPEGVVIQREAPFDPEAEIRFLQDGKEMRVQLTDPLMTRAYNNIWHPQVSHALRVLNDYNVWLRQMYTQKNPAWFALNIFKDIPSAAIYTVGEYGAKVASKVLGNIPKSLKAAWNFHHNKSAGPEMDGIIKMYLENGGYTGFAYVGDIEAQTQKLEGMIHRYTSWGETAEKFKKGQYKKGLHDAGVKLLNSRFIAWIEALNTTFENTTRLAVFKAAIDSGLSPKQAASLAKNASTNFNRRGEWGPNMNAVWLFSNAGIQGTRNVGHALFFSKHKGQVWVLMSGFIALGIMAGLMSDDDDDLIDDEKRGKALIFKFGNAQVSIPMPYGFGFFAGFGQLIVQAMKHPDEREKIAIRMADLTMSHFSPFGNPYAGSQAKIEGLANLTPTIGRPVVNTMVNISPFGGMMYPEDRYGNKPDSEKEWRATKGTVYDITAKWLNRVTGGDQAQEGLVSVSPESLKLGVSTLFGGAGRLATDSASLLFDIPNENVKAKNIPVVKYFYQKVDTDNYMNRFYRDSRQASDAYKTFRAYVKSGDVKSAESYLAEEHLMISMGKLVRRYSEAISEIRNAEDEIKIDKRLTAGMKKVRLAKLDAKRKAIAEKFNSQLKKM